MDSVSRYRVSRAGVAANERKKLILLDMFSDAIAQSSHNNYFGLLMRVLMLHSFSGKTTYLFTFQLHQSTPKNVLSSCLGLSGVKTKADFDRV
jgi:hypothetical protein